jgi:hypothetical protein
MSDEKATISVVQGTYEPCEECGAPLDPQQRYCVNCAARRGNGANPASRYFAAMSRKARRPLARPPAKSGPGSRAAAVAFFALLPVAVALGVVVGRGDSGGGGDEALLRALRRQEAAATVASAAGTTPAASAKTARKDVKNDKAPAKGEGKVVAQTKNGTVHSVTDFEASEEKTQQDTQIVAENPEQTGDNYIKAQQNLPDVTVIGGDPGAASAPTGSGVEP